MKSARFMTIGILLLLAPLLWVGASTATASPATPSVGVFPARNLVDGQRVLVLGTGLPAHETVAVVLCDSFEDNKIDQGCGPIKQVTSDGSGRVLTRVELKGSLVFSGPVGPGFPVFCRADHCRIFLAWGDPDLGEQQNIGSRELQFKGSPATINVAPAANLERKQWVTVSGTAFGAERHAVGVRQHICSRHADAVCYGDQRYVWTRVKNDGTYHVTYQVRRFVPTSTVSPTRFTDCAGAAEDVGREGECMMTAVVLDRQGQPDETFGSPEHFGEPNGTLQFAD